MFRRPVSALLLAALVAAAVIPAFQGTVWAQEGPQLTSVHVAAISTDPAGAIWQQAAPVDVPLVPQTAALPRLVTASVPTVSVRSINDGQRIAFRLEWADATRDTHATRPDEFRDAAAVLVPVGTALTNVCMGLVGELTNLWHWKADWQEDLDKGFQDVVEAYPNFFQDYYPFATGQAPYRMPTDFASPESQQYLVGAAVGNPLARAEKSRPVEVLTANGFGTAANKAQQDVDGRGVWENGRWSVVFTREMKGADPESANLTNRYTTPVAFAVWNGSNQEVGGRKQLSNPLTVLLERPARATESGLGSPSWIIPVVIAAAVLLATLLRGELAGTRRGPGGA